MVHMVILQGIPAFLLSVLQMLDCARPDSYPSTANMSSFTHRVRRLGCGVAAFALFRRYSPNSVFRFVNEGVHPMTPPLRVCSTCARKVQVVRKARDPRPLDGGYTYATFLHSRGIALFSTASRYSRELFRFISRTDSSHVVSHTAHPNTPCSTICVLY